MSHQLSAWILKSGSAHPEVHRRAVERVDVGQMPVEEQQAPEAGGVEALGDLLDHLLEGLRAQRHRARNAVVTARMADRERRQHRDPGAFRDTERDPVGHQIVHVHRQMRAVLLGRAGRYDRHVHAALDQLPGGHPGQLVVDHRLAGLFHSVASSSRGPRERRPLPENRKSEPLGRPALPEGPTGRAVPLGRATADTLTFRRAAA